MGKGKRRSGGASSWALVAAGFVLGVFVAAIVFMAYTGKDSRAPAVKPSAKKPAAQQQARYVPYEAPGTMEEPPAKTIVAPPERPRVAIVIDDMGQDIKKLKELLSIDAPVTVAVIPHLSHSEETASEAHRMGRDVIMHMPMEPKDLASNNPGAGVLMTRMGGAELRSRLEEGLKTVPYALGVNNHMGSRFTEDPEGMRAVLEVVRGKGLFFLDSRTTPASVAGRLALEMGVRSAGRHVFLDNERDERYVKRQIAELVRVAKKNGSAIGIGHPHPETFRAIKDSLKELDAAGVDVVRLSDVID